MVLFELPYSQVKEVEVEFYGLRFEDSKIFFRKNMERILGQRTYLLSKYTRGYKYVYAIWVSSACLVVHILCSM